MLLKIFISALFVSTIYSQSFEFVRGIDISILDQIEDNGGAFYENGIEKNPLDIFYNHGDNTIRLKLWHTPESSYNSLPNVLSMAERVHEFGFDLMLDIHYSDTWADPSHQTKPAAWEELEFSVLCDSIFHYTKNVITELKDQNTLPKFIQIGNETDCGFLWPDGNICGENNTDDQWEKLGLLFNHALDGIAEATDETDTVYTIVHVSHGDPWFYSNLFEENVSIDILGRSYYPWWHGTLSDLSDNLTELSNEFQLPVMVLETAYPFTLSWNDNTNNIVGLESQLLEGFPASEEGQLEFLLNVTEIVENNNVGTGICYWSPEWISTESFGSPWENLALFDFNGEMLQGMIAFESEEMSIDDSEIPQRFDMLQNFPNPFNPTTTIQFIVKNVIRNPISINIIDINGRRINELASGFFKEGKHQLLWNGTSHPSGIYFAELISGNDRKIKKMIYFISFI